MATEQKYTTGIIPVDVSNSESWAGGGPTMSPGTCLFRLEAWSLGKSQEDKGMIVFHFNVLDGPEEDPENKGANRGQVYRRNFVYDSDGGRNFYKGLIDTLNPGAWVQKDGKTCADFGKLVGIEFKGVLTTRTFPGKDGRTGTGYDVAASSIEIVKGASSDGAATPSELPAS